MSDPFIAEVRIFPFNFAPRSWAFCDGQTIPISQNTALFSLLGTIYGGNGQTNFGLPNLQGCAVMQPGQGPGLSLHELGESGGSESVTLGVAEIPSHLHSLKGINQLATSPQPGENAFARSIRGLLPYTADSANVTVMNGAAIGFAGGSQPHNNMMPYLTINFCIALQGIFPPRS